MDDWTTERTETVFTCPWFSVRCDTVRTPAGDVEEYYWVDRDRNGLGIVAVEDGAVAMVEQYRPKLGRTFLECPGGQVDAGESYVEAAARELREETGLRAEECTHLTTYYPTDTTRYERAVVVATGLERGDADPDETEFISWRFVPVEEALAGARRRPTTGWTLTPLLLARDEGYV